MSTKTATKKYLSFGIASAITIAVGYVLSLGAPAFYEAYLTEIQLPLGDSTLMLGGLYFTIVAVAGVLIAYFYERFRCA
jgi:ABC-type enterobactin transport system permease subunit